MNRDLQSLSKKWRLAIARTCAASVTVLLATTSMAPVARASEAAPDRSISTAETGTISVEDAELQGAVLAAEDRRLVEVRTVAALARWQQKNWKTPYRLSSAAGYTLVLTPRSAPYTIEDLLELAPQTFLRMSDGSYLLREHLVVTARATLRLTGPNGLTLRLASGHDGFATIVSLGGEIEVVGEENKPVKIMGWDVDRALPDEQLADGRAYVRAIGGQLHATHAHFSDLGFWSGRTGGLSLTGTDRPDVGALGFDALEPVGAAEQDDAPILLQDIEVVPLDQAPERPAGSVLEIDLPGPSYVSSSLTNVEITGNAFGLFVSGANGVEITDSTFTGNALGGVLLHRFVSNAVISRTTSSGNGGDGFVLSRATSSVTISESVAEDNARDGFHLAGRALADGVSATGVSLRNYGNNSVSNSSASNNGRYGIGVVGGFNIGLTNNRIKGHEMGLMVNGPAQQISVIGNTVEDSRRHGVAIVNGVDEVIITGNVVDGSGTGVYLRDSMGKVSGNTVQAARSHAVTLVGKVDRSEVSYNIMGGNGPSALDLDRSNGDVTVMTNNEDGWTDTTPWYYRLRRLLQPMTALWVCIAMLLGVSALRNRRRPNRRVGAPYEYVAVSSNESASAPLAASPPVVTDAEIVLT